MTDNNDYTRRNRFTGESIELTKEEAEKHDKIFYHEALATLEDLKQRAIDTVMESGTPEELIRQLDNTTKKIGIAWVVDTSKIKQIGSN